MERHFLKQLSSLIESDNITWTVSNRSLLLAMMAIALSACATSAVQYSAGVPARQIDPSTAGPVAGVGVEGRDYVSMTDQMIRDMLANRTLAGREKAPRIVIDSQYFKVGGSQAINRDLITERLRVNLNRAAQGRMSFIDRTHLDAIQRERDLKRQGLTDTGTVGMTQAVAGSDYLLRGAISSQDSRSVSTGMTQRYNQISFEMVDVESSEIVWSGLYEFARAAADDVVYR
jgi:curli biogenesis system outer membrane secretion channel CsgG